jgi:WD40 repeat protein
MGNLMKRQSRYSGRQGPAREERAASVQSPPIHNGAILGLASLSETKVVTCSDDKSLGIYDTSTRTAAYLQGHRKAVNRVIVHDDLIWSCSRDLSVKLWDSKTGECIRTLEDAHTLNVAGIAYSAARSQLGSGSRDYHVKTWDAESGACINDYSAPRNIVTCLKYDPSGNLLYQV